MPLGLLARDSIQDLENFGRDASGSSDSSSFKKDVVQVESSPESKVNKKSAAPDSPTPDAHQTDASDTSSPKLNGATPADSRAHSVLNPPSSYGQYTGFRHDYHFNDLDHDAYYYHDTYAPVYSEKRGNAVGFWQGLLPCLFPWTSSQGRLEDEQDPESTSVKRTASKDEDEVSNSSEIMGEKLSQKERQAVLNRLRLGQPDAVKSDHSSSEGSVDKKKGLLTGLRAYEGTEGGKMKGILKNAAPRPPKPQQPRKSSSSKQAPSASQRRALFPQYSGVSSTSFHKGANVSFAPMARVVTVKSRNDMTPDEKSDIWWQKIDYDDFRKTGRIITRAMLEGGSEIWLSSQSDRPKTEKEEEDDPADTISATGDKWWHKFGHSRRGLEHVVSIDEGRQRQLNVKRAIHSILEEQARQKLVRKQDSERLRHVSMQYTSWARDLALASGASDSDAVQSKFADDRKSREFYLLKIARNSPLQGNDRHVPDFMQPAIQAVTSPRLAKKSVPSPHVLDANTAAQIRYRRKFQLKDEPKREESQEPLHDSENESRKERIAQRAAGFSAEGDEKVNMAAVLSGMGAVPQNAQVISTA